MKSNPRHFPSPSQREGDARKVGAGCKPAQIATTLAGGVPRLAAPTEPGFRQNDTPSPHPANAIPVHPPSSPHSNRHPAQQSSLPRSHRHPRAAAVIPAQPTSSPRSRRHPRAAAVIPAQPPSSPRTRGTRRADKWEGQPTTRHSDETRLNVHPKGQANICHYPSTHRHPRTAIVTPRSHRHPRFTIVIPAQPPSSPRGHRHPPRTRGTRRVDKWEGPPNTDPESQPGPTNDSTDSASIPGFSPSSYSCTTATFLLQRRSNVIDSDTSPNSTRCEKGSVG